MESSELDGDLPLLAYLLEPRPHVDWETLMEAGVVPAILLGEERRTSGPR